MTLKNNTEVNERETIAHAIGDLEKHYPGFRVIIEKLGFDPRDKGYACFKATVTTKEGMFLSEGVGLNYKDPDDPLDFTFVGRAETKAKRRAINWLLIQHGERSTVHDNVDLDASLELMYRKIDRLLLQEKDESYIRKIVVNTFDDEKLKNKASHYLEKKMAEQN